MNEYQYPSGADTTGEYDNMTPMSAPKQRYGILYHIPKQDIVDFHNASIAAIKNELDDFENQPDPIREIMRNQYKKGAAKAIASHEVMRDHVHEDGMFVEAGDLALFYDQKQELARKGFHE